MARPRFPAIAAKRAFDPLAHAFPAQQAAIEDPATFVAITTSGRAGKTTSASLKWHRVRAQKPGQTSVFVALNREHAKAILWAELKRQNREWGLGLTFHEAELIVTDSKGSILRLLGANRDDLVDTLRGFPIVLIVFDEAAFFRRGLLERCVDEAIAIRLLDYGGQCWVISTPGYTNGGWFYRVSEGKQPGWSRHRWTIFDNPHIPKDPTLTVEQRQAKKLAWIADETRKKGWTDKTPSYQREFLGIWASDEDALVYPISERNIVQAMPLTWTTERHNWHCVLGIDYGVVNNTTHVLVAWYQYEPTVYVVRSRADAGMDAVGAAQVTQRWIQDENPVAVVGDAGGLGKGYVLSANERFGLAIENADKIRKREHQGWVASALKFQPMPRLLVVENTNEKLITQMEQLAWEHFPVEDPRHRLKEDPRQTNDLCDALLYACVNCTAHWPVDRPAPEAMDGDRPRGPDGWTEYLQ